MSRNSGRMDGRVALVTGASRGIGAAVARRYAEEGAHIIALARTIGGLEELDDDIRSISGQAATLVPIDITDTKKIDEIGALIFERFQHLDVFVGNAATLGTLSPLSHISPEVWENVIAVNLTANWRLLRALDPLIRLSEAGRAIFVTSTVGAEARAYWGPYSISKAGLEMMTRIYAEEVSNTPVRVNLINPGATRTQMRAQAMPGENPLKLALPSDRTDLFVDLATSSCIHNGQLFTC